jgi:hypothetical protein
MQHTIHWRFLLVFCFVFEFFWCSQSGNELEENLVTWKLKSISILIYLYLYPQSFKVCHVLLINDNQIVHVQKNKSLEGVYVRRAMIWMQECCKVLNGVKWTFKFTFTWEKNLALIHSCWNLCPFHLKLILLLPSSFMNATMFQNPPPPSTG